MGPAWPCLEARQQRGHVVQRAPCLHHHRPHRWHPHRCRCRRLSCPARRCWNSRWRTPRAPTRCREVAVVAATPTTCGVSGTPPVSGCGGEAPHAGVLASGHGGCSPRRERGGVASHWRGSCGSRDRARCTAHHCRGRCRWRTSPWMTQRGGEADPAAASSGCRSWCRSCCGCSQARHGVKTPRRAAHHANPPVRSPA